MYVCRRRVRRASKHVCTSQTWSGDGEQHQRPSGTGLPDCRKACGQSALPVTPAPVAIVRVHIIGSVRAAAQRRAKPIETVPTLQISVFSKPAINCTTKCLSDSYSPSQLDIQLVRMPCAAHM